MAMRFYFGAWGNLAPSLGWFPYHYSILKVAAIRSYTRALAFSIETSIDREFRFGVIAWLPAAIRSVQNYGTLILKVASVL